MIKAARRDGTRRSAFRTTMGVAWAACVVGAALTSPAQPARAQAGDRPTISIAASISAEPATEVDLPVRIGPAAAIPQNSFVRVRGLPQTAALSDGHSIAPGAWVVPLAALSGLKLMLPAAGSGTHELLISLVADDGTVLVEGKTTLAISPPIQTAPAPRVPQPATILRAGTPTQALPSERTERSRPSAPAASAIGGEEREQAMRLMKKGDEQLAQGNLAAARLFYERAAEAGLAQAAMALASTYDAAELARLNVRGIQPDAKNAQRWYERARQLGDAAADQRLRRLGAK